MVGVVVTLERMVDVPVTVVGGAVKLVMELLFVQILLAVAVVLIWLSGLTSRARHRYQWK